MLLKRLEYWDHAFFCRLFARSSSQVWAKGSYWLSKSADGPLYLLLVLLLLMLDVADAWLVTQLLLLAFALELPLYLLLKNSIKRARPEQAVSLHRIVAHIIPSDTFSLPSGHTAAAFVVVTSFSLIYPACLLPLLCWGALVGLSRVMLGVHFPLDILAGMVLGVLSSLTAASWLDIW